MKRKIDRLVALLGAVLCVCACLVGCERKETVSPAPAVTNAPAKKVSSRTDDAAYQAQLKDHIAAQRNVNIEREKIRGLMEQVRERARGNLPKGATDAQVTEEIENNPERYQSWEKYKMALMKIDEELERIKKAAGATINRRIRREVAGQNSAKQ